MGLALYGMFKTVDQAITPAAAVSGLGKFLPDSFKEKMRKIFPSLGSVFTDVSGADNAGRTDYENDEEMGDYGDRTEDTDYEEVAMHGLTHSLVS
jgi:hypothetical protein